MERHAKRGMGPTPSVRCTIVTLSKKARGLHSTNLVRRLLAPIRQPVTVRDVTVVLGKAGLALLCWCASSCGDEHSLEDPSSPTTPATNHSTPLGPDSVAPAPPTPPADEPPKPVSLAATEPATPQPGASAPPPERRCGYELVPGAAAITPGYAVELTVHVPRSGQSETTLCAVLEEMNGIWWSQAGVCFDIDVVTHDDVSAQALDLWFEQSAPFPNGVDANGVYVSANEIFSLDAPGLMEVRDPVRYPAARTAAHELGHAMGLGHQDCRSCDELLMRSGTKGFKLVMDQPADVNEIDLVRENVARVSAGPLAEELNQNNACAPARLPAPM